MGPIITNYYHKYEDIGLLYEIYLTFTFSDMTMRNNAVMTNEQVTNRPIISRDLKEITEQNTVNPALEATVSITIPNRR